ncbi:MAG TPA: gephyrin-like molybdotransferase Glp [Thermoanaerobaculia bacterium]|nr:gephyrin-like molybdotransferase Glp [Thermoanaerobaculia bacterium]
MITVDEAYAILDLAVAPLPPEDVPLRQARDRVVAADVASDVDWPPFDTSAMDGYAVRADEVRGEGALRERPGLVAAGDPPPTPLSPGEAVRLMTGAPLPAGADAVVPVELSRREGGRVVFERIPEAGAHLRRRGESVARGTVLLRAGDRLGARAVALAALAGKDPVAVRRRPRVAVAATGNELVSADGRPAAGKMRDSNGPMLEALCGARGWPVVRLERVADEPAAVARLFDGFDDADVLVTSGGVSAGDLDLLPAAAQTMGWEILFHRVAVRPGKPIAFARRGGRFWFGLPGNPVSASVTFHLFVRRALDRMEGVDPPGAPAVAARLVSALGPPGPRETYQDAVLSEKDGLRRVEALETAGSHDIAAHARANALILLPAGAGPLERESVVTCVLLDR